MGSYDGAANAALGGIIARMRIYSALRFQAPVPQLAGDHRHRIVDLVGAAVDDATPANAVAAVNLDTNSRRFIRISLVRRSVDPSATDPGEPRGLPQFADSAVLATSAIQLDATGRIASLKS